jgi:DHA1 family bicyclomycin/chloramphenicol resistance-like MFS transporter
MTGAVASGLVASLYDGHSALSMTALMALCSVLALVSYLLLARRAESRRLFWRGRRYRTSIHTCG